MIFDAWPPALSARTQASWSTYCQLTICIRRRRLALAYFSCESPFELKFGNFIGTFYCVRSGCLIRYVHSTSSDSRHLPTILLWPEKQGCQCCITFFDSVSEAMLQLLEKPSCEATGSAIRICDLRILPTVFLKRTFFWYSLPLKVHSYFLGHPRFLHELTRFVIRRGSCC